MARLAAVTAFIGLVVLAVVCLSRGGDPPETIIEFVPARFFPEAGITGQGLGGDTSAGAPQPICPKSMNPCRIVNCNPRTNPRVYT